MDPIRDGNLRINIMQESVESNSMSDTISEHEEYEDLIQLDS